MPQLEQRPSLRKQHIMWEHLNAYLCLQRVAICGVQGKAITSLAVRYYPFTGMTRPSRFQAHSAGNGSHRKPKDTRPHLRLTGWLSSSLAEATLRPLAAGSSTSPPPSDGHNGSKALRRRGARQSSGMQAHSQEPP